MSSIIFDEVFELRQLNPGGKRYEKVNRLSCKATTCDVDMIIDVNNELFQLKEGEKVSIALATTLNLDGTPDTGLYEPHPGETLMNNYDYVMHGRVFNIEQQKEDTVDIHLSFGGLLMQLCGEQSQLELIQPDMKIYLLMRSGAVDYAMQIDS